MQSYNRSKGKIILVLLAFAVSLSGCSFISGNGLDKLPQSPIEQGPMEQNQLEVEEPERFDDVQQPEERRNDAIPEQLPRPLDKKTTVVISAVGDIMMHMPQIRAAEKPGGGYDFKDVFQEIKPYIENADIALANLETTIGTPEKGYSGYPRFSAPHELLEALRFAGFDVLTTANNHCLDWLEFGVVNTLNKMDEYGIMYTGTARSFEESERFLIVEKNEIKVGILAYTYGTNGMEALIPAEKLKYMVNYFNDFEKVRQDIKGIKAAGAEVIVVCMHWGNEYERMPSEEQKDLAHQLAEAGADIIFGSHPHVIQPIEIKNILVEGGMPKKVFVAYSLGNFISNQRERYTDSGVIMNVEIVKDHDSNTVSIGKIGYVPTWVYKYHQDGKAQYRILPVEKYINGAGELQGIDEQRIQAVWHETTSLLNNTEIEIEK
ncbi:MAG: CapA family protein [Caldicoprobacter oshimai]|uniref:Poly-gamma-glutamate synthesis protein (Capsule biosynthesis protein) n=1 Tax=Caldicoprobacter faecalis TaxID=937334 RepID=A0A1I5XTD8_9FIRM|nr:CapA family protein [Caldicoprobacter faecalis]SFQ35170.1 poly-gamma-glutamate synthesis protein (capsule biosynthesis protein) [Caldicoprobacter faecalis]